jgi:hypoxanthine phosphoribosyltransferase
VKICALLQKKIPGNKDVPIDYLGFRVEDVFVVGYGLDHAEAYRNLPYIAVLEPDGDNPPASG